MMQPTLLSQLCSVVRQYRWRYAGALITIILSNGLIVLNPLIFRYAIAVYDRTAVQGLPGWGSVYPWAVVLLTVASISAWLKYHMRRMFISISRDAEADIRRTLFEQLQGHAQPFFDRHRIGDLMSRLVNDVSVYREVLGPGLLYPAYFVTMVVPAMIILFVLSPWLALLSLLPIFAIPPLMLLIRGVIYLTSRRVQATLADMSTVTQETFSGIRLVKSFGCQEALSTRFASLCRRFLRLNLRLMAAEGLFYPVLRLLARVVTVLLVLVASYMILGPWGGLSTADLVSFMWVQSYILLPVLLLGWILPFYQRGRGAYSRLFELYAEPHDVRDTGNLSHAVTRPPSVELTKLTFAYPGSTGPVLREVSARFASGQITGITGPPGSGKSTLFYLLARDYLASGQAIVLSGRPVEDFSLPVLRRAVGIVEQEPFLFSRTIAENIGLGRLGASTREIEEAAKRAGLHETVTRFPNGYHTTVGERGITLSGGQKQRVVLARALLANAPLLLLDDCFSALDAATADQILRNLRGLVRTTVLIITHRVSLLQQLDTVFVVQEGRITESGSPSELAQRGGHYAALVELERRT